MVLKSMTFNYNPRYEYSWPEDRLLSPTRVLDMTSDKSFLEAWKKRVGAKEADRIVKRSIAIGKNMHSYLEYNIKGEKPILLHKYKKTARILGNLILKKGLKDKLEEYWGLEAHVHFSDHYRGIIDLVGIYEGEPCVIDFKQKRSSQRREWVSDYFTQVAAYGMAHNKMFGTKIKKGVVLIATHKGDFQRFIVKSSEWKKHCSDFLKRLRECMKNVQEIGKDKKAS